MNDVEFMELIAAVDIEVAHKNYPMTEREMKLVWLREFADRITKIERKACIEDVRTVGGKFAVECEELINGR